MRGFYGGFLDQDATAFSQELSQTAPLPDGPRFFSVGSHANLALSPDGRFRILFSGILENRISLRQQEFCSGNMDSDAALVAHAWHSLGAACLPLLQGAFALAVYDTREHLLYLARDPLGQAQLYCYQDQKHFIFTTEIKKLQGQPLDFSIAAALLYHNLIFLYLPGEQTLFKNINQLLPGCYATYEPLSKTLTKHRYYRLPFEGKKPEHKTEQDWLEAVAETLQSSLSRQLAGAGRSCLSLSGGLDSSLIAALSCRLPQAPSLQCLTVGNTDGLMQEGFGSDLPHAQKVAGMLGLDLQVLPGDLQLEKDLDRMVWALEAPHGDPAILHQLRLSEAAAAMGCDTLLTGAAADDIFAGYRRHQALKWLFLSKAPASLKSAVLRMAGRPDAPFKRRLHKLLFNAGSTLPEKAFANFFWMPPDPAKVLFQQTLHADIASLDPFTFLRDTLAEIADEQNLLHQALALELRIFLGAHNLPYARAMARAAGIRVASPYLDTGLIALSARMPASLKLKGNTTKYILKKVAEQYLPHEIIYRKKTGFAAPIRSLLSGPLNGFVAERLHEGSLRQKGIFNEKEVMKLIASNAAGTQDAAYPIFTLLTIESWLRQFAP